ncbi:MAG: Cytosol aminopeptidase [Alphaproteobacteria bacterium MarineAlpha5_Bin11]|nr:MAG: Cytosol aminopeptidase [Alphaproteobacteria bacterium MarineAlpha5_Bin11]|tara:strand:- start:4358 stop:5821 length:1464 start_codon:yes stop_codon:yes gene_type:complete
MNILFNNSIINKKNPIVIVINRPSDILSFAKNRKLSSSFIKKIANIKKLKDILGKNRNITELNIVDEGEVISLIIFLASKFKKKNALEDGALLYKTLIKNKFYDSNLIISKNMLRLKEDYLSNFLTGLAIRSFKFDKYFTEEKNKEKNISINVLKDNTYSKKFRYDSNLVSAINEAKSLIAEPANILYPDTYAKRCLKLKKIGLNVKVLNKSQIEKIGMRALLGVAQGSVKSPKVVILEWNLKKNSKPLTLVGKGVTFDTGGISIKPSRGMQEMIMDMGGSAVVVGSMIYAALSKIKKPILGIIGLVENMPDANAQRPGDIVETLSGKTVEVLNTDAEGRLVLCDLLTYVQRKYNPNSIINFATLTGAIQAALGPHRAGIFSNNDKLSNSLIKCGDIVDEKLWRMPLGDEYDREIDGFMADISNIGKTPYGGATTAAQFLFRFIENNIPWAHLDIAGVTWNKGGNNLNSKGPTGFAVKLIGQYLKNL